MANRTYLMHGSHKYIRKEWKKGKWIYYYNDKKGNKRKLNLLTKVLDSIGEDEKTQLSIDNGKKKLQKSLNK